jgi:isocitrate dehydrogenase
MVASRPHRLRNRGRHAPRRSGRICLDVKITGTSEEQRGTHGSSTPSPTRPRCWPPTRSCRSSGLRGAAGRRRRDPRHLAGRAHPRAFPDLSPEDQRVPTPSPSWASSPRPPRPTSSSCPTSAPRSRSSRPPSPSCRPRASTCPTTPTTPRPTRRARHPRPLRQGQGQRRQPGAARGQLRPPRAPPSVKNYARKHPHSMGAWSADSKTNVATMGSGRLPLQRAVGHLPPTTRCASSTSPPTAPSPCSRTAPRARGRGRRRHRHARRGPRRVPRRAGRRAKAEGVLFSVHLKATMMKVSDPIIFGHVVKAFFADVFAEYGPVLAAAGVNPNNGLGAILDGLDDLPAETAPRSRPPSTRASPTARPGHGRLRQGHHQPARAERRDRRRLDAGDDPHVRPDVEPDGERGRHPRRHPRQQLRRRLPGRHRRLQGPRRLRPRHHGLGAQRGPHGPEGRGVRQPRQDLRDRRRRRVEVVDGAGHGAHEHDVAAGDIWRACQTKDAPIQRLGEARRHPRPRHRRPRRVLARPDPRPRRATSSPRSSTYLPTTTPTA